MTDLLSIPASISPRLAWLSRHGLFTRHDTLPHVFAGADNTKPWLCANRAMTTVGSGDDEREATLDYVRKGRRPALARGGLGAGDGAGEPWMTDHPAISVTEDLDSGDFVLMATSYGMAAPAGPRLFRAPPHPEIKFRHDLEAEAIRDAAALTAYIEATWPKKAESKAALRKRTESRA